MNATTISYDQWQELGKEMFGEDQMLWRFKCPVCGHVASTQDYMDAGAPSRAVGFSCIGRWSVKPPIELRRAFGVNGKSFNSTPCDYAGGGLFGLNPVRVTDSRGEVIQAMFEFAPIEVAT